MSAPHSRFSNCFGYHTLYRRSCKRNLRAAVKHNINYQSIQDRVYDSFNPYTTLVQRFYDEVEIFNRALTSGEILAIYNAGSAGRCLLAWFRGGRRRDANDSLGYTMGPAERASFAAGVNGQAFSLDGVDDSVDIGSWVNYRVLPSRCG